MASFAEYLRFQVASNPGAPAIVYPRGVVEYGQFLKGAMSAATRIAANFRPGDLLALRIQNPELHCCMIVGGMLAGVTTLSLGARGVRADNLNGQVSWTLAPSSISTIWPWARSLLPSCPTVSSISRR